MIGADHLAFQPLALRFAAALALGAAGVTGGCVASGTHAEVKTVDTISPLGRSRQERCTALTTNERRTLTSVLFCLNQNDISLKEFRSKYRHILSAPYSLNFVQENCPSIFLTLNSISCHKSYIELEIIFKTLDRENCINYDFLMHSLVLSSFEIKNMIDNLRSDPPSQTLFIIPNNDLAILVNPSVFSLDDCVSRILLVKEI